MSKGTRAAVSNSLRRQLELHLTKESPVASEHVAAIEQPKVEKPQSTAEPKPTEPTKVYRWFVLSPCCHAKCTKAFYASYRDGPSPTDSWSSDQIDKWFQQPLIEKPSSEAEAHFHKWRCPQCSTEYSERDETLEWCQVEIAPEPVAH
jgi:hypothetical protein